MNHALALAGLIFALGGAAVAAPPPKGSEDFPKALTGPVLAAWIPSNTSIRLDDVIAIGGGRVVALTRRSRPAGAAKTVRITIRTEIVSAEAARQAAARSEVSELDINCAQRKAKLVTTQTYSQRDLTGTFATGQGWAEWVAAAPNTTLDRMVTAACDPAFRGAFSKGSPVSKGPAAARSAPAAAVPPPPELRRASSPIGADAPQPTVLAAAQDPLPPPAPPPPPPIEASPTPRPAPSSGQFASQVQVSASTSRAQAQASLDSLKQTLPALAADHETSIEPTTVEGQTYYRALVGGFADAADARAFCTALKAAGGDCVVRQR